MCDLGTKNSGKTFPWTSIDCVARKQINYSLGLTVFFVRSTLTENIGAENCNPKTIRSVPRKFDSNERLYSDD